MSESDFLAKQKITCKPEAKPDVKPEVCPDCVPNPNYVEPSLPGPTGPYYNEATCEYCFIFPAEVSLNENELISELEKRIKKDVKKIGLEAPSESYNNRIFIYYLQELCEYFKKTTNVNYLVSGSDNEEKLTPLEDVTTIEVKPNFDGLFYARICVPKLNFEKLPSDDGEEADDFDLQDEDTILRMKADEFIAATYRAQFALKAYNTFYKQALAFDSGYLFKEEDKNKTPIKPSQLPDSEKVKAFRQFVSEKIRDKGYKFGVLGTVSPFPSKRIDEIKLVFDNASKHYSLKTIFVKPSGCRFRKVWKRKITPSRTGLFSTHYMMSRLEDIDYDIRSESGPTWHEFYEDYLFPKVKLEYSLNGNPLTDKNNPLNCALNKFGDFNDFLHSLIGSFEDAMAFLAFEIDKEACEKTVSKQQDKNENNSLQQSDFEKISFWLEDNPYELTQQKIRYNIEQSPNLSELERNQLRVEFFKKYGKKNKKQRQDFRDAKKFIRKTDPNSFQNMYKKTLDPTRGILESILVRIGGGDDEPTGQEAIQSFKDNNLESPGLQRFISTVTFCELNYLFQNVIKCLLGGVPFEQAAVIILRSYLKSLSSKHLGKLIFALPLDKQREVQQKVEKAIDSKVQPWSDSWADGGFKDTKKTGKTEVQIAPDESALSAFISEPANSAFSETTGDEALSQEEMDQHSYEMILKFWQDQLEELEDLVELPYIPSNSDLRDEAKRQSEEKQEEINNKIKSEKNYILKTEDQIASLSATDYSTTTEYEGIVRDFEERISIAQETIEELEEQLFETSERNIYKQLKEEVEQQQSDYEAAVKAIEEHKAKEPKRDDFVTSNPSTKEGEEINDESPQRWWDGLQEASESGVIGETTQIILDAYIEAILDSFKFDELLNIVDNSPVAKISIDLILGLFGQAYCPSGPLGALTDKYLKDVTETLTKFKYEPCTNEFLKRPKLPEFPFNKNLIATLKKELGELIKKAIKKAINALILKLVFKAIRIIDDLLCKGLAVLGNNAFNSFLGNQNDLAFADLFGNAICEDLTPNEGLQALEEIMNNMNLTPQVLSANGGDPREITKCLSRSIGITISKREVFNIFLGNNVSPNVYDRISNTIVLNCPDLRSTIGNPAAVESFFDGLRQFISPASLINIEDALDNIPIDESVCEEICLKNETLNQWNALRIQNLENSGMNNKDAIQAVDNLNDIAAKNLDEFVNASNNLQDLIADELDKLFSEPPPGCDIPDDHPLKLETKQESDLNSNSDFLFSAIESKYYDELSGNRKSIMSTILQDTYANRLRTHKFYTSWLGTRWFYKDKVVEDDDGKTFLAKHRGYYPDTVGNETKNKLKNTLVVVSDPKVVITSNFSDNEVLTTSLENKNYKLTENGEILYKSEGFNRKQFLLDHYEDNSFLLNATEKIINLVKQEAVLDSGYEFGFVEDKLEDSDFDYLNPDGKSDYSFKEEDKVLGVSGNPERVIYLNPAIHGGKYEKPKIYIVPQKQKGWMAINDALSDNSDYCGENKQTSLSFDYLREYVKEMKNKIPLDNRLAQDPGCIRDLPFDHIADPETLATLSGLVKATIQVYSMREIIALFPIMSQIRYTPDDFGKYITDKVASRMKSYIGSELRRGLLPKQNKRIKWHRYWFLFLEQAVETYNREIKFGLREKPTPGSDLDVARKNCARLRRFYPYADNNDRKDYVKFRKIKKEYTIKRVKNYPNDEDQFPTSLTRRKKINEFYSLASIFDREGAFTFDLEEDKPKTKIKIRQTTELLKNTKKLNFVSKIYAISRVEQDCVVILNQLISEQIEEIFKILTKTLEPEIYNLNEYLLNEDKKVFLGSKLKDIGLYSKEKLLATGQPVDFGDIVELFYFDSSSPSKNNFIIEKYVRVNEKPNSILNDYPADKINVTTLKKFKELLRSRRDIDKSKNLSDYFGSFIIDSNDELSGEAPASFGIRVSWIKEGNNSDSIEKTPQGLKTIVLDSFEYDMFDEKIETFLSDETNNKYDLKCLVSNLVKQEKFITLMNKVFGKSAVLEHLLAYHDLYFFSSIGMDDGWDPAKAEEPDDDDDSGEDLDLNKIEETKEQMFKKTSRLLMSMFESAYKEDDFEDQEDRNREFNNQIFGWLRDLIPTTNLTGLNLDLWKRRRIVNEIENCDEDLLEILEKNL